MINIFIIDDHELVREGIKTLLDTYEDIEVVGEASDGEEALSKITNTKTDIVLMDIKMPKMDGIEATRYITKKFPNLKIIILTSFVERKLIEEAIKAGAIGYLLKDASGEELVGAINKAMKGKSTLSSEASDYLISGLKNKGLNIEFTSREKEILELIVNGMSNNEIADELFISPSTVKFHVSNVLSKLGAPSRSKAISIAIENKLV